MTVHAFDVDMVQTDGLGSSVTSPSGTYRIDYPGDAFRQGTVLDIELIGGPDLFFSIADGDGNVLLEETRQPGRPAASRFGQHQPALTSVHDPAAPVPNSHPSVLHRCTYIVTLSVTPRLHNGVNARRANLVLLRALTPPMPRLPGPVWPGPARCGGAP